MDEHISLQAVYLHPSFSEYEKPRDTRLKTDDGAVFEVYSDLLSRKSEFFRVLFSKDEEIGQITVIQGIESRVFKDILVYLYTGCLRLTTKNMLHFLVASDFLMIEPLLNECKKFVLRNKSLENCVSLYLTAYRIKGLDIESQCRRFFLIFFENAVMHSVHEAINLPYEALKHLLSHRSLNVCCERFIWCFIETWVQADPTNRLLNFPELLRFLCINDINPMLASDVIWSPLVKKAVLCDHLGHLDDVLKCLYDKCKAKIVNLNESPFITSVRLPPCLYLVTKNSSQSLVAEVFISYDDKLDVFRKLKEVPLNRGGLLAVDHRVHILRETDFGRSVMAGSTYDLLRNELRAMATCPHNNMHHIVVEVAGIVFALGIFGRTVYLYLEETDEWISVSPMQEMYVHAAVSLNGRLYVIGETDEMVMQEYDHSTDTWRMVSPPNLRRRGTSAVVYQGKIFLLGGKDDLLFDDGFDEDDLGDEVFDDAVDDDDNMDVGDEDIDNDGDDDDLDDDSDDDDLDFDEVFSRDVEVYDPAKDEWVVYPELPFECEEQVAVVIGGRLYVYNTYPSAVAYWDGSGQWKVVDNPQSQMFQYRFCAIEREEVVREMMKRNREAIATAWLETDLEKVME